MDARSTSMRQVGQVCCLWNQERRQLEWKMWLQGSFLAPVTISSRQMMQTLSEAWRSSGVASGYSVFMLRMARRDMMASVTAFLNCLMDRYMGLMANRGKV